MDSKDTIQCMDGQPHNYIFLRGEVREVHYRKFAHCDTFYCSKCLKKMTTETVIWTERDTGMVRVGVVKKAGRPKLSDGEAKDKIITVRFRQEDINLVEETARANKQTVSEWIRDTVLAVLDSRTIGMV